MGFWVVGIYFTCLGIWSWALAYPLKKRKKERKKERKRKEEQRNKEIEKKTEDLLEGKRIVAGSWSFALRGQQQPTGVKHQHWWEDNRAIIVMVILKIIWWSHESELDYQRRKEEFNYTVLKTTNTSHGLDGFLIILCLCDAYFAIF